MTIRQLTFIKENSHAMTVPEIMKRTRLPYNAIHLTIKRHGLPFKPVPAKFDGEVPAAKELRIMGVIKALCQSPMSADELSKLFDVERRTIYRYMTLITALGVELDLDGKKRYSLKECPICKSQKH